MVLKVPTAYLYEYCEAFEEMFGVRMSESRVSQILHQHGLSLKKALIFSLFLLTE